MNKQENPQDYQTHVERFALSINDLKCGNIVNYHSVEDGILTNVIDWQDLKSLTENPSDFNKWHSPKQLTEDILKEFGAIYINDNSMWELGIIEFYWIVADRICLFEFGTPNSEFRIIEIKYVHELQNLYYSLKGKDDVFKLNR